MELDDALPLDAPALQRAANQSPLALHAFLEQACVDARRRHARRLWVAAAGCQASLRTTLETWGFVLIPAASTAAVAAASTEQRPELYVRAVRTSDPAARRKVDKIEPELVDDEQVRSLVQHFETCTLPFPNWTHRAHLAVGIAYLREFPHALALERIRRHIRLYNQLRGDPDGYHETITQLFLRKIASIDRPEQFATTSMARRTDQLARECSAVWMLRYYSRERLNSRASRTTWVDPDLQPLDF